MQKFLPSDGFNGTLLGRAWIPQSEANPVAGPSPVWVTENGVLDLSNFAVTTSALLNKAELMSAIQASDFPNIGSFDNVMSNTMALKHNRSTPYFLSPFDLQAIKACGVTFAASMIERVIEERAAGDLSLAAELRADIAAKVGENLSKLEPGSAQAEELKHLLKSQGLWSQYLEVGIGPDAEVFTKAQPLSTVGPGAEVGLHPISNWNNPEPEIVLAVNCHAKVVGASLGNDVNLRDIEGRSALLLGKAKDNNASCAIGPFIRLFDDTFNLNDVRKAEVSLVVEGVEDQFELRDGSSMREISRDVLDLVSQTISPNHQYPDGLALFTGTLFAPTKDRDEAGNGFTHKQGDIVTIASDKLGSLQNRVTRSNLAPPWEFGITALMQNLAQRNLLNKEN